MNQKTYYIINLVLLIFLVSLFQCSPTYAPPIRSFHGGAPSFIKQGRVKISGGAAGPLYIPSAGGPEVSVAVTDNVQLEVGGNFNTFSEEWAMGFSGLKISSSLPNLNQSGWIGDLEFGGGLGVGGELHPESDGEDQQYLSPHNDLAYGGYLGAGGGYRWRWFSLFTRARAQWTKTEAIPLTFWGSGILGLGFISHNVQFHLGYGWAGYSNSLDAISGPLIETGISLSFDLFGAKKPRANQTLR